MDRRALPESSSIRDGKSASISFTFALTRDLDKQKISVLLMSGRSARGSAAHMHPRIAFCLSSSSGQASFHLGPASGDL